MSDYEVTWDDQTIIPTLKQLICDKLGNHAWKTLTEGICVPNPDTEGKCGCCNMRAIIERLEEMTNKKTIKAILFRVRHGMTREQIGDFRKELSDCGNNIDSFLEFRRKQSKEEFINQPSCDDLRYP